MDFQIRSVTQHDFAAIVHLIRAMLSEMYALQGRELSDGDEAWLDFEDRIERALRCDENGSHLDPCAADHLLQMAELIGGDSPPIGVIQASIIHAAPVFRPVQTLYIHALYVLPEYRQHGVGTALLHAALVWGEQLGCVEAELSVLPHNPARQLYKQLGFQVRGVEMRKEMTSATCGDSIDRIPRCLRSNFKHC